MRSLHTLSLAALVVGASAAHAQVIVDPGGRGELPRTGAVIPHGGVPSTTRYSYGPLTPSYVGYSWRQLAELDYLDRVDRAERFGYPPPVPPPGVEPVPLFYRPRPARGLFRR